MLKIRIYQISIGILSSVETVEKYTKAPKYFNEASILAFMENPKAEEDNGKLVGLGTAV